MKTLPLVLFSAALALSMVACTDPTPPPVIESTTASLNLTLNGVTTAPVKVANALGELKFDGSVTSSKVISELPRGKYIVLGGAVNNFTAPAAQLVDLSGGDNSLTLTYTSTPTPTTADLNIVVTGVPAATVKIIDAAGAVTFDGPVTGSKTLAALPRGKYTVTGGSVPNFAAPATQTADLSAGNGAATLNYLALAGQALVLDKIQGTLSDPQARGNKVGVGTSQGMLVTATVGTDGSFNLPLPPQPLTNLYPFLPTANSGCSYTGVGSAMDGNIYGAFDVTLFTTQGDVIGQVFESPVGKTDTASVIRMFADVAQSYKGTITCPGTNSASYTVNVQLKPGWNAVVFESSANGLTAVSIAPADMRVQLSLAKRSAGVVILLNPASLNLKVGESVSVSADFLQNGGISGKLDLSTNVPGVTVEPASVMLAPLGTQSIEKQSTLDGVVGAAARVKAQQIGAQRLSTTLTIKAGATAPGFNGQLTILAQQNGKNVGQGNVNLNLVAPAVTANTQYGQGITVKRGQSQDVNISAMGTGLYRGDAKISLEGLPAGVTATTATVTFAGAVDYEGQMSQLTVTVAADAQPGSFPVQLTATANGVVRRTPVTVLIPTPAFNVLYPNAYGSPVQVAGFQGETVSLPVSIKSVNGYTGAATLTLSGLPAGITSPALSVNLEPDVEARANLQIVIGKNAVYGSTVLTLSGTGLSADNGYDNVTKISLTVNIARITPAAVFSYAAPTPGGIWTLGNSKYVSGNEFRTLTRFQNGQVASTQDLQVPYWISGFTSTPGGDAVIVSTEKLITITQAGILTSFDIVNGPSSGPLVIDKFNRLWFTGNDYLTGRYRAATYDLATGTLRDMFDLGTSSNYFPLYIDNAGANIYLTGYAPNSITKFNVDNGDRKEIALPGNLSVSSLAATNDGVVWGTQYMGAMFKLNTDGTASVYSSLPVGGRLFFDRGDANTLWSSDLNGFGSVVHKINVSGVTDSVLPVGNQVKSLFQDPSGGAWAISSDNTNTYLSLLK